jgi:hypothetical protein
MGLEDMERRETIRDCRHRAEHRRNRACRIAGNIVSHVYFPHPFHTALLCSPWVVHGPSSRPTVMNIVEIRGRSQCTDNCPTNCRQGKEASHRQRFTQSYSRNVQDSFRGAHVEMTSIVVLLRCSRPTPLFSSIGLSQMRARMPGRLSSSRAQACERS